ncbi:MAG: glycosyltransferase family 117 protein, partial [bacterium]
MLRLASFIKNPAHLGGLITSIIVVAAYLRTLAPTASFWDCGEFIACSYILGVPHPPGAPLYLLLGRFFSMLPFAADIGWRVNLISALASAATVWLTYLIILQLIREFRRQEHGWPE